MKKKEVEGEEDSDEDMDDDDDDEFDKETLVKVKASNDTSYQSKLPLSCIWARF